MKRYLLIFSFALWLGNVAFVKAGEIVITLPDATLQQLIDDVCAWGAPWSKDHHCEADRNGGHKGSDGRAAWVIREVLTPLVDKAIFFYPGQHPPSLEGLGGHLSIRYDQWPADWPTTGRGE